MNHKLVIVFLILIIKENISVAQDSICFIDKKMIVAKISEVGIVDLKYYRFDNLDGPQYIVNKSDIRYVKFQNGVIDTMASYKGIEGVKKRNTVTSVPKIFINHYRLSYDYHGLNDDGLEMLLDDVSDKNERKKLLNNFESMKEFKRNQYIFGYLGLGTIAAYPVLALQVGHTTDNNLVATFGISAAYLIATQVISRYFRTKRYNKKLEIALRYNNLNE
jgi:hypothetical protein